MSKSIMAPARFRDKAHRARHELEHVIWHIDEIEDAAGEGDERCKKFISEHSSGIRAMRHCRETWRGDALRIIDEVEESTAKREGKVFCDVCRKNVKNISDHRRRSSSHKGRARVRELDHDPSWKRISRADTKQVVDIMLSAPAPSGTQGTPEYQWNHTQKAEHRQALNDRMESVSDLVLVQNYSYHSSGKENKWGHEGGKYWVRPHIDEHADHLMSIIEGIRTEKNLPRYGYQNSNLSSEFRRIVDPIIRNPNDIVRHAAMYALQLNRED